MKPGFKVILGSIIVALLGATVIDATTYDVVGVTLMAVGGIGIMLGPLAIDL